MSAAMARQGGPIQLKQCYMRLVLIVAKMVKEGFSPATIDETQFLINKPPAEVSDEKKQGIEFPAHTMVKAAIE